MSENLMDPAAVARAIDAAFTIGVVCGVGSVAVVGALALVGATFIPDTIARAGERWAAFWRP